MHFANVCLKFSFHLRKYLDINIFSSDFTTTSRRHGWEIKAIENREEKTFRENFEIARKLCAEFFVDASEVNRNKYGNKFLFFWKHVISIPLDTTSLRPRVKRCTIFSARITRLQIRN